MPRNYKPPVEAVVRRLVPNPVRIAGENSFSSGASVPSKYLPGSPVITSLPSKVLSMDNSGNDFNPSGYSSASEILSASGSALKYTVDGKSAVSGFAIFVFLLLGFLMFRKK